MGKESILEKFEKHKGELVICDFHHVQRLIGVAEDQDDLYWVYYNGRGKVTLSSCVGGFIPLKGFIEERHYENLKRIARLNDYDLVEVRDDKEKTKEINDAAKKYVETYLDKYENDNYITPICWDLN